MKILQVIPYFYPAWRFGGPVKVAYDISRKLVERGHSVTVYTSDILDENHRIDTSYQNIEGVEVYYFKNLSLFAAKRRLYITPSLVSAVRNNIGSFDVVHIHGNRTAQSPLIHYFLKKKKVPYVVQAHGGLPSFSGYGLKWLYDLFFGYSLLKDASRVIAVTDVEMKQYFSLGLPKGRVELISNGVDLSEYVDLPQRGAFREKFGISSDEQLILYLGRINKIKGVDVLVKAFSSAVKKIRNLKLILAGPDDGFLTVVKGLIKALNIDSSVLIVGPLYGQEKLAAYVDADVYILPSCYEIFGMTILESLACGTPVILMENCGIAKYFADKVGLAVKEPSMLEGAILKIFENKQLREVFKNNCQETIKKFDLNKPISELEDVYESVQKLNSKDKTWFNP